MARGRIVMNSRTLASALAIALLAYIFARNSVFVALNSIFTHMTVLGWLLIQGGDDLSQWLGLTESNSSYLRQLKNRLIAGIGWLSLLVVSGFAVWSALAS